MASSFDIFDMISGLSMAWIGRLPCIDILTCHKDELKAYHELPPCVAWEGVKLRYLTEAKFEESLSSLYCS